MGLRALLRRRHEVSADAPSEEGAQRCFESALEARRGRGEHTLLRQNGGLDRPQ